MDPQKAMKKPILCLCLALLLLLSLAACDKQAEERDSAPPTTSVRPTPEPTLEPTPTPPIPYTDVPEDAPYYDAVVWAYESGIASDGDTFEPDSACTRGQVLTFLWRAKGSPEPWIMENPFSDASPDAWYYKPALWAYQHNVATSAAVKPGDPCTGGEALTFLWRAEGKPDRLNTLAASGTYYGQPVAWAENNGLFTGEGFDPAAPCTHADLMSYLYWAAEEWTPSEEEQGIQTEYDKILYGLDYDCDYAEYIDVDGDGRAELLTLERRYNNGLAGIAIVIYADMGGHVAKSCEWESASENTFSLVALEGDGVLSLYSSDGQLYLCLNQSFYHYFADHDLYNFYKIEKGAVTFSEQRDFSQGIDRETGESYHSEYTETSRNYAKQKDILRLEQQYSPYSGYYLTASVLDKGILPSWEECRRFWAAYWAAYWEASDPMYAAALSGDFSALAPTLAGDYEGGRYEPNGEYSADFGEISITIDKGGVITGDHADRLKAVRSVTVEESGAIYFETAYDEYVGVSSGYTVYLPGCAADLPVRDEPSKVRISRWCGTDGAFEFLVKSS